MSPNEDEIRQAGKRLDAHVRDIAAWHFDPKTGCPFWLERAKSLRLDPRKEVQGFDDLKQFGLFEDERLRGGPVGRWGPLSLPDYPSYGCDSGGTTGIPN